MNEYPAVLWRLLGLIDDCQHDLKWSDIPDELHGNALQIGLYRVLIETDSQKHEGPIIAVRANSPEATERIAAFFASMNPTLWLSRKGRYELAMHRETEAGDAPTDEGEQKADQPKRKHKPATVNQRMAGMVQGDASLISWPASKWAQALGCTDGNVKQTSTWKKVIMPARALMRADRAARGGK